jgi:enoyl-CoA hydratase/carnithine racemase
MATAYETIILDKLEEGRIAKITLNRPDKLNAINQLMQSELCDALDYAETEDEVRVVIITGEGRAFCAGADTGGMTGGAQREQYAADVRTAEDIRRGFKGAHQMILGIHRLEKPVIAMVNGAAVGAGFDMASVCDLRVGSSNARFMVAYVRIGLFPGYGGAWLYPRALGSIPKAAELLFTGDFMEAEEAHRYGFLNKLVAPEELEEATLEMARKIANGPPIAIRLAKMMLYRGLEFDLETSLKMAAAAETITLTSEDHKEGIAAFREKRRPAFRGR